jgi:hypothetical protein
MITDHSLITLPNGALTSTMTDNAFRHACEVEVTFPTNLQAQQALEILQVDQEPTDRVTKVFDIVCVTESQIAGNKNDNAEECVVTRRLKVRFESTELKMLRVSVSSFYDYLAVVLRTFQEFDTTVCH